MSDSAAFEKLRSLLAEFGIKTVEGPTSAPDTGFPLALPLSDGGSLTLDLPQPALLSSLDPENVGAAILDPLGYARRTWGLAKRIRFFHPANSLLNSEIGRLVESAFDGVGGSLYLDGYRYHVSGVHTGGNPDVFVLVTNASEERMAKRQSSQSAHEANALKRLGRVLTMNMSTQPLCVAAVHEIASASELAAVLLWTVVRDENSLVLSASTGANRRGIEALSRLSLSGGATCVAELVAGSKQNFSHPNVMDHVLTEELEGRFCYLKPGGLSIHPLVISGQLVGVLELIGRDGDSFFPDSQELFQTMAEHLALALNSALLFESFERLASHDPLTGIANHRTLQDFLRMRLSESQRSSHEIGVMMVDVDHFRSFNEEEGHETGDAVLKLVAETLRGAIRQYDLAARYGGEEFTIVLPSAATQSTIATAERIRKRIESIPIQTRSGRQRHVTVSIGCSQFPTAADDGPGLLRAADIALYEAKRSGRNRVVMFEGRLVPDMREADFDLSPYWTFVPENLREAVAARLKALEPTMRSLCKGLGLSRNQFHMLQAIAVVEGEYRLAEGARRTALESASELRSVLPSLQALEERFDGAGPTGLQGNQIPILARTLAVVMALIEDAGRDFLDDPGRFDPEIVAMLGELDSAA